MLGRPAWMSRMVCTEQSRVTATRLAHVQAFQQSVIEATWNGGEAADTQTLNEAMAVTRECGGG